MSQFGASHQKCDFANYNITNVNQVIDDYRRD